MVRSQREQRIDVGGPQNGSCARVPSALHNTPAFISLLHVGYRLLFADHYTCSYCQDRASIWFALHADIATTPSKINKRRKFHHGKGTHAWFHPFIGNRNTRYIQSFSFLSMTHAGFVGMRNDQSSRDHKKSPTPGLTSHHKFTTNMAGTCN